MKVVLTKNNELTEVNDSYALNYLIPKGLAVKATETVLEDLAEKAQKKQEKLKEKDREQREVAQKIDGKTITIKTKANEEGELYGSIGKQQIKKALGYKQPIDVKLPEPIKHVGSYLINLKIGKNRAKITLKITAS
ncbi:MAG: 50S ribosomal protein L9 [Patescibacteria group bacterium]|jgi:large subunit ribosomal protein L9